jgi:hypothetical protein
MESILIFLLFFGCIHSLLANSEKNNNDCISKSPWEKYLISNHSNQTSPEKLVDLKHWSGRLGNNFVQINTFFRVAICCRTQLSISRGNEDLPLLKRYFDFTEITDGDLASGLTKSTGCDKIQASSHPHDMLPLGESDYSIDESCSYDSHSLLNWVLYGLIDQDEYTDKDTDKEKALGLTCPTYLKDDALVVQIRSGDIFRSSKLPNHNYKQPPVAFYEKVFQSRKWKSITFVTEKNLDELLNPVWLHYINDKHRQKNMKFHQSSSFQNDLHLMTCSHYLVAAHSSLFAFMVYIAPNLKGIYTPTSNCSAVYTSNKPVLCSSYHLKNYTMGSEGNWTNSPEQREIMISYNIKNVEANEIEKNITNERLFKDHDSYWKH